MLSRVHAGIARAHAGRDDTALLELAQIDEVERSDAGRDAIRCHSCELTACEGQSDQIELLDDVVGKPRVGACIESKCRQVVAIVVLDLLHPIPSIAFDGLAFAEHAAGHGIERIVLHAHEGTAKEIYPIQHHAAGYGRLPATEVALGLAQPDGSGVATEIERMARARRDSFEDSEIEVNRVPARDHVRIERHDAITERLQRLALVGTSHRFLGHVAGAAIDDQHFVDARRVHRDGEQPLSPGIGLDVE